MPLSEQQLRELMTRGMTPNALLQHLGLPVELQEDKTSSTPMHPATTSQDFSGINPINAIPEPQDFTPQPVPVQPPQTTSQAYSGGFTPQSGMNPRLLKEAEASINEEKAHVPELAGYQDYIKNAPNQLDLSPLAALVDSWTGSNLQKGYTKPTNGLERIKSLADLQGVSQKQRDQIADSLVKLATSKSDMVANNKIANLQDMLQKRQDFSAHKDVITGLSKDKELGQRLGQYRNLDNSLAIITKAKNITPQQIREFQQSVRSNLGIKGTSGVDERTGTYLDSIGLRGEAWRQFLSGEPANISKDNAILMHIKDLAKVEQENIKEQMAGRVDAITSGYEHIYDRRPDLKQDLKNKIDKVSKQFTPKSFSEEKAKTVIQNGYTYTLNEKTGEYE